MTGDDLAGAGTSRLRDHLPWLLGGVLVAVVFLQVIALVDNLNLLLYWGDVEFDVGPGEDPLSSLLAYGLIGAMVLAPFLILGAARASRGGFWPRNNAAYLCAGLVALLVVMNLLGHAALHDSWPFVSDNAGGGSPNPTGWRSPDIVPVVLLVAWAVVALDCVVPAAIGSLVALRLDTAGFTRAWHVGLGGAGIALALRWGGPWGSFLHQVVFLSCAGIILAALGAKWRETAGAAGPGTTPHSKAPRGVSGPASPATGPKTSRGRIPLIDWIPGAFFAGCAATVLEVHANNQNAFSWLWFVPGGLHLVLLGISLRSQASRAEPSVSGPSRLLVLGLWTLSVGGTVTSTLLHLSGTLATTRVLWALLGTGALVLLLEWMTPRVQSRRPVKALYLFVGLFFAALGALAPLAANLYDPLTSYGVFAIALVVALMLLPRWRAAVRKS